MNVPTATSINELSPLLPLILVGIAYAVRARTLGREGRAVGTARIASFYLGLVAVAVGSASPLDAATDKSLIAHTSTHMLIGQVGAFFIVLGLTGGLLQPLLKIDWVSRLRVLSDPRIAFTLWVLNIYLWHAPPLFELALENAFFHALEHGLFLALGVNLWMPLIGPLPQPKWFGNVAKLVYVVLVFFAMMILGNVLVWSGSVFYAPYEAIDEHWGLEPLADQNIAGGIMMTVDTIFTMALLAWLFMRFARENEESQQLVEYAREQGVELSHERSARAVASGNAEHLRRRVGESVSNDAKRSN